MTACCAAWRPLSSDEVKAVSTADAVPLLLEVEEAGVAAPEEPADDAPAEVLGVLWPFRARTRVSLAWSSVAC